MGKILFKADRSSCISRSRNWVKIEAPLLPLAFFTARIRTLLESNVFSHVYLSAHKVGSIYGRSYGNPLPYHIDTWKHNLGLLKLVHIGTSPSPPHLPPIGKRVVDLRLKGLLFITCYCMTELEHGPSPGYCCQLIRETTWFRLVLSC